MKKKVAPKLRQEVKVKVDIVTSDIKIYYTGKFQDFTYRYVIKREIACNEQFLLFPQCFPLVWRFFCHFHQI